MKKTLRIIALASGITSLVATLVLGCIYFESFMDKVGAVKGKLKAAKESREEDFFIE